MLVRTGRGLSPLARPGKSVSVSLLSSLPSWLTYTRADTVATYRNSSGKWVQGATDTPRFDHDASGTPLGLLMEESRSNKNTNYNVNPSATTNLATSGDAAGVLSVVSDTSALATANLDALCTNGNVFKADNSGGSTNFVVTLGGTVGNTNPHSYSIFARATGGTATFQLLGGSKSATISGSSYTQYVVENDTPDITSRQLRLVVGAGRVCYFILNGLQEGKFYTTPIVIQGASATRAADKLVDTSITTRNFYSAAQGAVVADFVLKDNTNQSQQHFLMLAEGTGLTNCMSAFMWGTRSKWLTRTYVDSSSQSSSDLGSVDKAGVRFPFGITWRNGAEVTVMGGAGVYGTITPSDTIDGIDRFHVGGRNSTEQMTGYVRSLKFYNHYRSIAKMGADMVLSGEYVVICSGQSNMKGAFASQTGSTNGGEKAGIAILDGVWNSTRNWLADGSTTGTSVLYYSGVSTSDSWWYNASTQAIGTPFQRWLNIASACKSGTFKAIIDTSGESDAGQCTKQQFKDGQIAKFTIMRNLIGNVPVILVPIGRNTSSDLGGYQTIREAQQELASENPSWIFLAPERFDLALTDTIHLTDAGYQTMMQRACRKLLSALGETVSGPVNGSTISGASRSGTSVTVTLSHPSGITDFTPTTGIEGFKFFDNTSEISIAAAVRTNATTITLTLNSTPSSGTETLYYGHNSLNAVTPANLVKGNDANTLPLRAAKITL